LLVLEDGLTLVVGTFEEDVDFVFMVKFIFVVDFTGIEIGFHS
jgi:hypothetical protein